MVFFSSKPGGWREKNGLPPAGGFRSSLLSGSVRSSPGVQTSHLESRAPTPGRRVTAGKKPPRTERGTRKQPRPAQRAGAFPADAPEALPIFGPILLSDASAVSGQIPGIPSPTLPGRAAAPGRGRDFPGRAALCARKAPGPGPGRPRGRATLSWARAATRAALNSLAPETRRAHAPSIGPDPGGAEPRPRRSAGAVGATPARKGGARLPVSPPVCRARSWRLPGLVLSGQLFGPLGGSPKAETEVQSCWLLLLGSRRS